MSSEDQESRRGLEKYWLFRIREAREGYSRASEQLRLIAEGVETEPSAPVEAGLALSRAKKAERVAFSYYWRAVEIYVALVKGILPPEDDELYF